MVVGQQIINHGLAQKWKFTSISFLLILIAIFSGCQSSYAQNDASIFLGPPLGETFVLGRDNGTVIKRTTTAISEAGVYFIEDRIRTKRCAVTQEDISKNKLSEKTVRIMRGEEDLVDKFTLQAKGDKIILTRDGEISLKLNLQSKHGFQYLSSSGGKIKMESRIVDEKEEFLRGRKRASIYVESVGKFDGGTIKSHYKFVSGLGLVHMGVTAYGVTSVLYTLKVN